MNKVWVISKREFLFNVKRWQFWAYTLLLPVAIVIIILGTLLASAFIGITIFSDDEPKEAPIPYRLAVVDQVNLLDIEAMNAARLARAQADSDEFDFDMVLQYVKLPEFMAEQVEKKISEEAEQKAGPEYLAFPSWEAGLAALEDRQVRGLLELPLDYRQTYKGRLLWYDRDNRVSLRSFRVELRKQILGPFVGESMIDQVIEPLDSFERDYLIDEETKEDQKQEEPEEDDSELPFTSLVLAIIYMATMLTVITSTSDRLLRGLAEEKQNRVIETLLSSVTSNQLLAGKVLGLGALTLVQFVIWFGTSFIPAIYLITFIEFDPFLLLIFMAFMSLGYLLNAVSILGLGSLGNNYQEASQWSALFIMTNMIPFFAIPFLLIEADGLAAKILTYVPITAPMVVVFRMGADSIQLWEIGLSLLILAICCYLALRFSGKLFRMGLLMTGQKPTPKTIWRMWRVS